MNPISSDHSQHNAAKPKESMEIWDKARELIKVLDKDLDASDFKWTLFVAAANSYKYDSLLRPFPSAYATKKVLNISDLRETIASIPRFSQLLPILRNVADRPSQIENDISDKAIELLYWCLMGLKEPTLKSINRPNVSIV